MAGDGDGDKTTKPVVQPTPPTPTPAPAAGVTPPSGPAPQVPAALPGGNVVATPPRTVRRHRIPPRYSSHTLRADPVTLFPLSTFNKNFPLADTTIPVAKGIIVIGGIPVTYDAEVKLDARAWLGATYGPGIIDDIELELGEEEAAARDLLDDDPIVGVRPFGWFGPKYGIGPSPRDVYDKALRKFASHEATATARVHASAFAGFHGSGQFSAGADVAGIFGGGVTAGLTADVSANASAGAYAYIRASYEDGKVTVTKLTLGADFSLTWSFLIKANAGIYVELKVPDIPILTDLTKRVSKWPIIGWVVPDLSKLKWRKDFTKSWDLIKEQGKRTWNKDWDVLADGTSPSASHSLAVGDTPYDFKTAVDAVVAGAKPKEDIPDKDEGPDKELKDGAKASVVTRTRHEALAQIHSARANIKRERTWNTRQLAQVVKRIKKAAAAPASGSPKLAAAPSLAIGGGGSLGGTPDEQEKQALDKREDKLEEAEAGAKQTEEQITKVKDAFENRIEGPARNEAREGFEKLGENADQLGQAVGGYGPEAGKFARPVDPAVPGATTAAPGSADAEKARLEARKLLDETHEVVDGEMIRSNTEWHDANAVDGLALYAGELDGYRADIRNACETPLKALNTDHDNVPTSFPTPDEQTQAYRTIIIPDARSIRAKFDTLRTKLPAQPWDTRWAVLADRRLQVVAGIRKTIRETLYPSEYWTDTNDWLDRTLQKLGVSTFDGKEYWRYTGPRYGQTTRRGDDWWLRSTDRANNERPTIDHKLESVARHWNRSGRREDQRDRALYYNGYRSHDANLDVLPKSVNSAKGNTDDRIEYLTDVGVKFRGPR